MRAKASFRTANLSATPYLGESTIKSYLNSTKSKSLNTGESTSLFDPENVVPESDISGESENEISHALAAKQWEGYISEVQDDMFIATLYDCSGIEPPITAEFEIDTYVSKDEKPLVRKGVSLYWIIGKEVRKRGQVKNGDYIHFKRMPTWKGYDSDTPSDVLDEYKDVFGEE